MRESAERETESESERVCVCVCVRVCAVCGARMVSPASDQKRAIMGTEIMHSAAIQKVLVGATCSMSA